MTRRPVVLAHLTLDCVGFDEADYDNVIERASQALTNAGLEWRGVWEDAVESDQDVHNDQQ